MNIEDFNCRCGECGKTYEDMDTGLLSLLTMAENIAGIKFKINSGIRCKKHNASNAVKGSLTSSHLTGLACDISAPTSRERFLILSGLITAGFKRIGVYKRQGFIHCDNDCDKAQRVIW